MEIDKNGQALMMIINKYELNEGKTDKCMKEIIKKKYEI